MKLRKNTNNLKTPSLKNYSLGILDWPNKSKESIRENRHFDWTELSVFNQRIHCSEGNRDGSSCTRQVCSIQKLLGNVSQTFAALSYQMGGFVSTVIKRVNVELFPRTYEFMLFVISTTMSKTNKDIFTYHFQTSHNHFLWWQWSTRRYS